MTARQEGRNVYYQLRPAGLTELHDWLEENEYTSVEQLKGSMSRGNAPDPGALERANYMKALISYSTENPTPFG